MCQQLHVIQQNSWNLSVSGLKIRLLISRVMNILLPIDWTEFGLFVRTVVRIHGMKPAKNRSGNPAHFIWNIVPVRDLSLLPTEDIKVVSVYSLHFLTKNCESGHNRNVCFFQKAFNGLCLFVILLYAFSGHDLRIQMFHRICSRSCTYFVYSMHIAARYRLNGNRNSAQPTFYHQVCDQFVYCIITQFFFLALYEIVFRNVSILLYRMESLFSICIIGRNFDHHFHISFTAITIDNLIWLHYTNIQTLYIV